MRAGKNSSVKLHGDGRATGCSLPTEPCCALIAFVQRLACTTWAGVGLAERAVALQTRPGVERRLAVGRRRAMRRSPRRDRPASALNPPTEPHSAAFTSRLMYITM